MNWSLFFYFYSIIDAVHTNIWCLGIVFAVMLIGNIIINNGDVTFNTKLFFLLLVFLIVLKAFIPTKKNMLLWLINTRVGHALYEGRPVQGALPHETALISLQIKKDLLEFNKDPKREALENLEKHQLIELLLIPSKPDSVFLHDHR